MNIPIRTPVAVAPAKNPPRDSAPITKPTARGIITAMRPGRIIFVKALRVTMSIHRSESGLAFPSIRPLISLNCLLISITISSAVLPTALMVSEAMTKGIRAPIRRPMTVSTLVRLIIDKLVVFWKAENRAKAVNAAEPIANPFPMAAVVLPKASSLSVIFRIPAPALDISAIPPALSAMGP